ncbi:tubulin-specific chaperone e [Anaeramoeba flamelloides]|uniref:Tubulin-specific chaperone e n=1 Tax=Anaeramoeba flamelloides TaxID=1746091 RepID=A0ABQ8X6R0_9EUKA|nr:tubulin-specific chaperone e [Anaeramoeba flamelloides]
MSQLGKRFSCGNSRGWIKWEGTLPTGRNSELQKWYGVEWDESERGKHSGAYKEKQIFQCSKKNGCSFLKPSKANFGQDLFTILNKRYLKPENFDELSTVKIGKSVVPVSILGDNSFLDQWIPCDELTNIIVSAECICSVKDPMEIQSKYPKIETVDLSCNLFTNWKQIEDVLLCFPLLKSINISGNEFEHALKSKIEPNTKLKHLSVCGVGLQINEMELLLESLPNLEEIEATHNQITKINVSKIALYEKLTHLDLTNNNISNWSDISCLSKLPLLESLNLNHNKLQKISLINNDNKNNKIDIKINNNKNGCNKNTEYEKENENENENEKGKEKEKEKGKGNIKENEIGFKKLQYFSCSNNLITDIESIFVLNKLPNLINLEFRGNNIPQINNEIPERFVIIASIPNLQKLNGSIIRKRERIDSEILLIDTLGKGFPRYDELIQIRGVKDNLKKAKTRKTIVKISLIHKDTTIKKKIPLKLKVKKLKFIFLKLFKISPENQILIYHNKKFQVNLDNDNYDLNYYGLQDNDSIVVNSKN